MTYRLPSSIDCMTKPKLTHSFGAYLLRYASPTWAGDFVHHICCIRTYVRSAKRWQTATVRFGNN